MKVLLLSCSTGEGHNSAAHAVLNALENRGAECELSDPVAFQSDRAKKMVASAYNNLIKRAPSAFGAIYKAGAWYSSTSLPSPIYHANAHYAEKLYEYILKREFDVVVCTHLYGMEAMTAIYAKTKTKIPTYGILTDYTCIPFFAETNLTGYFIPHEDLASEMIDLGFSEDCLFSTGIPVDARFKEHISKEQARNYLSIPQNKKIALIMTGGIGSGDAVTLCRELCDRMDDETLVYVLCGRNIELKEKIRKKFDQGSRVEAISFTKKVNLYMKASDVLISKPGGISSSEAATIGIPLVHTMAIPGCETKNAEFFEKHGMSVNAPDLKFAAKSAIGLIDSPVKSIKMVEMQKSVIHSDATDKIVNKILGNEYE